MYFIKFIYYWLLPPGIFILLALFATILAYRHHHKWRHTLLIFTGLAYFFVHSHRNRPSGSPP